MSRRIEQSCVEHACKKCNGSGTVWCEDCKGEGTIPQKEYKMTIVSNNDEVSEEIMQKIQDFAMDLRKQNKDRASILVSTSFSKLV